MVKVSVGDHAPDFSMTSHAGEQVALADYAGEKIVVLFFYPKDDTPVCTREACAFRDAFESFLEEGAVVIGVSSDGDESHRSFAQRHRLPFVLLADRDGALRKLFGVPRTMGLLPGRVTYVIDPAGVVRHLFVSQFSATKHVEEAMRLVRQLSKEFGLGAAERS
ncbi:Putative peroxiredoxin bcp [Planctomycetes bacterium Pan216]|uniref:thioredoxin-dependent peroxiredoxin n=1 Tax=Kolteria novifilia TaxID=2527975 RepID=A0A518B7X4_9BACT|nr:Putative peroxiredoxin bcp [Planctomycetes bacterium Pan216]